MTRSLSFSRPAAGYKRCSVVLPLLLALVAVSSSALATAEPVAHANINLRRSRQLFDNTNIDVPFYVKEDTQGNLVAVLQYGSDQDSQDHEDTEILVPCSSGSTSTGPGDVLCQDLGEGHYQLVLPFRFERDANGVIVAVIFDDTVQKIPFCTVLNQDGSVVGITTDTEDLTIPFYHRYDPNDGTITDVVYTFEGGDRQEKKLSGCGTVGIVLACVLAAVLLGSLFVTHSFWCGMGCRSHKNEEVGEDAEGTNGTKLGGEEEHETETLASDDEEGKSSNGLE